jgi:hypothetical protein
LADCEWEYTPEAVRYTLGIQQPLRGWKEVERAAPGYSKTNAGKTDQSRYYYRQKEKQKEEAKKELQQAYGDISRFFIRPPPPSPAPAPPPSPDKPVVVDFETAFFKADSFANEVQQLDIWLKAHGKEVTGAWLKRVQGVRDLLLFQGSFLYRETAEEERKARWEEYSRTIAVRLGKGWKFARYLRRWEKDWFNSRTPPPCPAIGRHVKRQSLFNDEGVILAVREYLNTALWNADPAGLCAAVRTYLASKKAYSIMHIDAVLNNKDTHRSGICTKTAQRWLTKLGWIFGRNKKGYCDGHEREDVVEYRQKVFCPKMVVRHLDAMLV